MVNRRQFELGFKILSENNWLLDSQYQNAIFSLIRECISESEEALIASLFERFVYVDDTQRRDLYRVIANRIVNIDRHEERCTQVSAITTDRDADSSQSMIQAMKLELKRAGWHDVKTGNLLGKARNRFPQYNNVLLIDEFVGTGRTMESRIRWLRNECDSAVDAGEISDYQIHVYVLAAMEYGIRYLKKHTTISIFSGITLKKGLSGYLSGSDLSRCCKMMLRMESELARKIGDKELPIFGYGHSQSLFSTRDNPPNNNFPILWWEQYTDGRRRETVLQRVD